MRCFKSGMEDIRLIKLVREKLISYRQILKDEENHEGEDNG